VARARRVVLTAWPWGTKAVVKGQFARLLKRAGLREVRLHDSRHTTLSLMEKAGVPISVISKWAGHYDAAFTMRIYVHASDDDLRQGTRTLAWIHKIA
jgi:integrase